MIKKLLTCWACLVVYFGHAQVFTTDNFVDRTKLIDNTLLSLWGSNLTPTTAFQLTARTDADGLTFNSISLTATGMTHSGYTAANSLKTQTSIDYALPLVIDRMSDTITIEFDAIWQATSSSGENGRMVVTLMDQYPAGGALFDQVNDISLTNPFGRPLYNIRIRNNTSSGNGPLMLYGAGTTPEPEWEKYGSGPWWLPGFSVQAGGGSPGSGPNYPLSGTMLAAPSIVSTARWRHYTWKIYPERMELYSRNTNQPASANLLSLFMHIPRNISPAYIQGEILAAHGTSAVPPNYDWYQYVNAVRFYWRGAQNFHLANVEIRRSAASLLPFRSVKELKARSRGTDVMITGKLEMPDKSVGLQLQHSTDGRLFQTLQEVTTEQISGSQLNITHQKAPAGPNFYRLQFSGIQGKKYSEVVSAVVEENSSLRIFPNPNAGSFRIEDNQNRELSIRIFNANGSLCLQKTVEPGSQVNLNQPAGIYRYELMHKNRKLSMGTLILR
jgi:hypothetical protein